MPRNTMASVELGAELLRMIEARAKQEGISRSEYIRECIYLELLFSGDLEAMKFLVKKVGARSKAALVDKLVHLDVKAQVSALQES